MQMSKCLLVLLAFPAAVYAQQKTVTTVGGATAVLNFQSQVSDVCPIGIVAKRSGTGQTMWTISQEDKGSSVASLKPGSLGVHVTLTPAISRTLRQVDLSVAYIPAGVRYTPVQRNNPVETYHRKTFQLVAGDSSARSLSGDLLVGKVGGITRVFVTHALYADGTEWTSPGGTSCSVEPNGFLLIDAAK